MHMKQMVMQTSILCQYQYMATLNTTPVADDKIGDLANQLRAPKAQMNA